MKELKQYICDGSTPTDNEILDCIDIAKKENCVVRLQWTFPYSGTYILMIYGDETLVECKLKLPKTYPV